MPTALGSAFDPDILVNNAGLPGLTLSALNTPSGGWRHERTSGLSRCPPRGVVDAHRRLLANENPACADNPDDPEVYLLAKGLAEVVDGRLQATRAGYELRKRIERER
jgi:hypothetical protein